MNLRKSQRQCPTNLEFAANVVFARSIKCWFLMYGRLYRKNIFFSPTQHNTQTYRISTLYIINYDSRSWHAYQKKDYKKKKPNKKRTIFFR